MKQLKVALCLVFLFLFVAGVCSGALCESAVSQKVTWVVNNCINSSMTQLQKAQVLHDWLIDNAYYDTTLSAPNTYEAAGVLLNGTGVCDSYTKAYILLLEKAGIESKRIAGKTLKEDGTRESHSWNIVKIDGKWYQVDVTWDDPVDPGNLTAKKSGLENHMYFMASKRFMNEDHFPDSEGTQLIAALVEDDGLEELPAGVEQNARHRISAFSVTTSSGKVLNMSNFGSGRDLIMVYGRIQCGNTRKFLSDISPYCEMLSRRNVTVLVLLFDDPTTDAMKAFEKNYPGIVCGKLPADDSDYSLWEALDSFGYVDEEGYIEVVFPAVFLKNKLNRLTYCSTDYVDEPLKIVAGALEIPENQSLYEVSLPGDLWWIDNEAFRGARFSSVELGNLMYGIGEYAFADNRNLKKIYIPSSVGYISDTAFANCPSNMVIVGKQGTEAQRYAIAHGFTFSEE